MTTRQITSETKGSKATWLMALSIAGAAALAVAAVSIGAWRGAQPHSATADTSVPVETISASLPSGDTANAGLAPVRTTLYLVNSEEEAASLRGLLATYGGPRPEVGQPTVFSIVLIAGSDMAGLLDSLPLPPVTRVVDMRAG